MHFAATWLVIVCCWIVRCWAAGENAIVIPPSEYFDGNDGPWSSFFLRVGTPEQDVRVLVSTAAPESLVVLSEFGCSTSAFSDGISPDCAKSRGTLFNPNESSTWQDKGIFGINADGVGLEANLGYEQPAQFLLETLGIGLAGPRLDHQVVGGIGTANPFYLGIFGLNNQPFNFTSLGNSPSPAFITTLKDQGVIPSLSWSYTAGARYRLKQVYGQLILSGYDKSRFTENSVSFTMADDITRDLVVVLQSISYSGSTSTTLLSEPIDIFIDSTDSNLWLPDSVCDAFEAAFGLTVDGDSGLYLVNDTQRTALQNSDAEVSFRLSDVTEGGDAVTITLPYGAFDLSAKSPLVENSSYYFPLKRAANSTQYTLGRAFLQEAYLSADYERGTFNVSACAWVAGAEEDIVTITSRDFNPDNSSPPSGGSSLSSGAVAGIVIGAIIGAAIIVALIVLLCRRHRKKAAFAASASEPDGALMTGPVHNAPRTPAKFYSPETVGSSTNDSNGRNTSVNTPSQMSNIRDTSIKPNTAELDGNAPQIYQLQGQSVVPSEGEAPVYHELDGNAVRRPESDQVSTIGTLPSRNGEGGDSPPSPFVSTLDTLGWQEMRDASSDLVSPTTPVRHSARHSMER